MKFNCKVLVDPNKIDIATAKNLLYAASGNMIFKTYVDNKTYKYVTIEFFAYDNKLSDYQDAGMIEEDEDGTLYFVSLPNYDDFYEEYEDDPEEKEMMQGMIKSNSDDE